VDGSRSIRKKKEGKEQVGRIEYRTTTEAARHRFNRRDLGTDEEEEREARSRKERAQHLSVGETAAREEKSC